MRLLFCFLLCGCTITVRPISEHKTQVHHHVHHVAATKPTPAPVPVRQQVHKEYQDIYEKIPPAPPVQPTPQ